MIFSLISSRPSEILSLIPFGIYKIFSFLIVFIILYVTQFYFRYFNRPNPLPGPIPLPIFGNAHQTIGYGFNDFLSLMHKKYGDIYEVYLGGRMVIVCRTDLTDAMNVNSTKTKYFVRFKHTEGYTEYGLDNSALVFGVNRKSWKYSRQFFSQAMMTPSFNHQAIEWTNELWKEMDTCWVNAGEDRELDLSKWIIRFTNDIIFRVTTGVKSGSIASYNNKYILKNNDLLSKEEKEKMDESENFIRAIDIYIKGINFYMIFNKFMRHYVPFIREKGNSLLKNRDYLFNRFYKIIEERKIEIDNTPLDQPLRQDMLTSFITANTSRDINTIKHVDAELLRPMTDKEIFGNILDSILAGTDTTANLLCFVVYCLEKHPEVKQRLRQELDEVLGKDLTKLITYDDIEQLKYCDAVIKEVTRHYPVSFLNGRVSSEDDNIGGYNLSAGTEFLVLHSAILKCKDYWTDPESFDPNRFYKIEGSDKYTLEKQNIKNAFPMFGEGIRKCPGRKLAMIEITFLLASVYRKYDVELVDINAPLKYVTEFIATCGGLLVKIKPRKF